MIGLLLLQTAALLILLARLAQGRTRLPPLAPVLKNEPQTSVSVIIPTLNEENRLAPCLEGLHQQGNLLKEVLIVDSRSTDGTLKLVEAMTKRDARFRWVTDDPLPPGWVGRPWALQYGFDQATSEWVLGIDADTLPQPGLVAAVVKAAETGKYDALSLSPCFVVKTNGENWLHPALLLTLIWRCGPTASAQDAPADRVLANGQCFLSRRAMLANQGGYSSAKASFCDDVTLVRHLARNGVRVGFLDGSRVLKVRMYTSFMETWREWGRSLDLKDATTPIQQLGDVVFLVLTQGLPLPLLIVLAINGLIPSSDLILTALIAVNGILLALRLLLLLAMANGFEGKNIFFWLSPLADPLAVLRIILSSIRRPKRWRGREY